jgi:predicted transporter
VPLARRAFIQLIGLAFLVAAPIAWKVMDGWMQNFQYRFTISPGVFLIALLATVFVALLTISFQSIRAALVNPVNSLRTD